MRSNDVVVIGSAVPVRLRVAALHTERTQPPSHKRVHDQTDEAGRVPGQHGARWPGRRVSAGPGAQGRPHPRRRPGRARERALQRVPG